MPLVIPIFIPHQGCPHHCLFCNQVSISGKGAEKRDDAELVRQTIEEWLGFAQERQMVQVAFYGGSFTCLPVSRQQRYLAAVQPFLDKGRVASIRLSTRPDCMDEDVCDRLLGQGVKTVELGVQSFDDAVLAAAERGHSSDDSLRAAAVLKAKGLEFGIQLMPGLPLESSRSFLITLAQTISCRPDFVRLYPTLVVNGSGLADAYRRGEYRPMSMSRAIAVCCFAKKRLEDAGVKIMRIGLQASSSLESELVAGPYHPAFGECVAARQWFLQVRPLLAGAAAGETVHITISHRDMSAFVGPGRRNIKRLEQLGLAKQMKITTDKRLKRGTLNYVIN